MTVRSLNLREVRRLGLASDYDDRVTRVSVVATRHNLVEKRNAKGELVWVGEPRPNVTELLNELLPERRSETNDETLGWHTYSLLSARAHGNPWAVLHKAISMGRMGPYASIADA